MRSLLFSTWLLFPFFTVLAADLKEFDDNKDGKVDRRTHSAKGQTTLEDRDLDFDGFFETQLQFFSYVSDTKPIQVTTTVTPAQKVERKEFLFEVRKSKRLRRQTQIFDEKGVVVRDWSDSTDLAKASECQAFGDLGVEEFARAGEAPALRLNNGYLDLQPGHRVHESCLTNWGRDLFVENFQSAMSTGLQCLGRLASGNNGARVNLSQLESLFATTKVTVLCHQRDYEWNGVVGHASTGPADAIKDPAVAHPYISLNPTAPNPATAGDILELKKTLFHEQLHNLGLRHGHSIEYPYACEDCCISEGQTPEDTALIGLACKVCTGDYAGTTDKRYVLDIINWGNQDYRFFLGQKAATNYLKESPRDPWGYAAAALASSDIFNPFGSSLAAELRRRVPARTAEVEGLLVRAEKFKDASHFKFAKPSADVLAKAHMDLFFAQDAKSALATLEKNKEMIKAAITAPSASDRSNRTYVAAQLRGQVKNMLYTIWLDQYPHNNDAFSPRAYTLFSFLGL